MFGNVLGVLNFKIDIFPYRVYQKNLQWPTYWLIKIFSLCPESRCEKKVLANLNIIKEKFIFWHDMKKINFGQSFGQAFIKTIFNYSFCKGLKVDEIWIEKINRLSLLIKLDKDTLLLSKLLLILK